MRILFVHGRAQGGKDPQELKDIWIETLAKGFAHHNETIPADLKIDFPFYGDLLDEYTEKAKLGTAKDVVAKGGSATTEFEEFLQSAIGEIEERRGFSKEEISAEYDGDDVQEKGIANWGWVQAIVKVIDKHLTPISDFTIEMFLTDVFLYVRNKQVNKGINKVIEAELTGEPTIIISHSLGTVVAYDVLRKNRDDIDLVGFITVGSPLGIKAISTKLGVISNPAGGVGWFNAYDDDDIVALNPLNKKYFKTDPLIGNFDGVDNQTDNQHGIIGYLNDKDVAGAILKVLK